MTLDRQLAKIARLDSTQEVDGYEEQAKLRGIEPDEYSALLRRRRELAEKGK